MHMPAPFLRQTEEHRCSSRVVVCGGSLLKRQTTRSASSAAGCAALVASHVPPLREYIPLAVSHFGVEFAPWIGFHTARRLLLAFLSVSRRLGSFVNGQKPIKKKEYDEQKTWLAGWPDSSLVHQDGTWLSSTSLLIRLCPSLVPPVNTTCSCHDLVRATVSQCPMFRRLRTGWLIRRALMTAR